MSNSGEKLRGVIFISKVKIIADSCSDLPQEIVDKYEIEILNIPVHIEDKIYYDRDDLQPADFYKLLREKDIEPKTSRITPERFKKCFQKYLADYEKILVIAFSSKLSGIAESAVIAKNELNTEDIVIIDSKAAAVGFGLLVYQAAVMLENGEEFEQVVEKTAENASYLEHIFAVGDLEMLKKGGRISKTKAFFADVLNIKPILHIQDGEILPYDRVRGKKRMYNYLLNEIDKKCKNPAEQIIGVSYSKDLKAAEKLKNTIIDQFEPKAVITAEIGAAVGSHAGPGTLGVVFQNNKKIAEVEIY
nr:DegV family protein [Halanaerobium polyolivorans]